MGAINIRPNSRGAAKEQARVATGRPFRRSTAVWASCRSHSAANAIGAPLGGLLLHRAGGTVLWTTAAGVVLLGGVYYSLARRPVLRRIASAAGGSV
ncbi:MAG: hypothetical protein HZB38_16735 [Planctomycetes bacterium]|nr:hypothetical protein [Planctomycetota bacterium]